MWKCIFNHYRSRIKSNLELRINAMPFQTSRCYSSRSMDIFLFSKYKQIIFLKRSTCPKTKFIIYDYYYINSDIDTDYDIKNSTCSARRKRRFLLIN